MSDPKHHRLTQEQAYLLTNALRVDLSPWLKETRPRYTAVARICSEKLGFVCTPTQVSRVNKHWKIWDPPQGEAGKKRAETLNRHHKQQADVKHLAARIEELQQNLSEHQADLIDLRGRLRELELQLGLAPPAPSADGLLPLAPLASLPDGVEA